MSVKLCSLAACLGAVLVAAPTSRAADREGAATASPWPQWHGVNRDGKSLDKGLLKSWPAAGPKLLWKLTNMG